MGYGSNAAGKEAEARAAAASSSGVNWLAMRKRNGEQSLMYVNDTNESIDEAPHLDELTPREIVKELDKYVIGQSGAKRAVAIALRNRIRRHDRASSRQASSASR